MNEPHTLDKSGNKVTTYNSDNNGEAYRVHLEDSDGGIVLVKAAAVERILEENLGREKVNSNHDDFPHLSKEVLEEPAKLFPENIFISWKKIKVMNN